jgi:NarL family two-component system response regulator LiaR
MTTSPTQPEAVEGARANGDVEGRSAILLDPYPLWLDALERILHTIGIRTIAKTARPADALAAIERLEPELLIAEPEAEDEVLDGFACMRQATARMGALKVVAISSSDDPRRIESALDSGAHAYVVKEAHPDDLLTAVRQSFAKSLFLQQQRRTAPVQESEPSDDLTRREREILALVADGRTNIEVARMLWITEQTVKFHLANVYRKLGVGNRTEASRWAFDHGLLGRVENNGST